jgi:thioredoxin-like negative regulator of GroEL
MERHTAQNKFGQADMLYQQGRFDEALALLEELDQAFPNSPNVMFPRARCLVEIGETNEALDLLEDLALHHQHQEAIELKSEINDAMITLTQPSHTEARHRDGQTPEEVKAAMRSSSHAGSVPEITGNKAVFLIVGLVLLIVALGIVLLVAL